MDAYRVAHRALCDAGVSGLEAKTELVGHRLLSMCAPESGQVNLTWDEYLALCGCNNVNSARRHLTRLTAAGLIHYSSNAHVFVTWLAWLDAGVHAPRAARPCAEGSASTRRGQRADAPIDNPFAPPTARPRAGFDPGRADLRAHAPRAARPRAEMGTLLVSQSVDPIQDDEDELTDCGRWPDSKRSIELLTDPEVGLDFGVAGELARRHSFEALLRHVLTWRREVAAGKVRGAGALLHRIGKGFGATVVEADRASGLYRRHVVDESQGGYVPSEYADIIIS